MPKTLTDIAVRNLKPGPTRREVPDGGAKGLRLIIQPSGVKTYAIRYRHHGRPMKLTLGDVSIGLASARKLAGDAMFELARGADPAEAKRQAKRVEAADSFAEVARKYMALEGCKLRSAAPRQSALTRLILPALGSRPVVELRRSEIVRLLDAIEADRGPAMAHIALSIIGKILRWHAARTDDFVPPLVRGMGRYRASEHGRERILNDAELARVWKAAESAGAFGRLLRFLTLTGARRDEGAYLRWDELNDGVWTLPASRNKVGRELVRPLSKMAQEIIASCPRIEGCAFVFSANGRTGLNGLSHHKRKLDAASGTGGWTIHDLRRCARSLMSRAGVPSDHAERCLGHVIGGVRGTYDRHQYQNEMGVAYEKLSGLIQHIIDPQPNVVPITARG